MTGILSLITFLPMVGVLAILALKVCAGDDANKAKQENAAKWIALAVALFVLLPPLAKIAGEKPPEFLPSDAPVLVANNAMITPSTVPAAISPTRRSAGR